MNDSISKLKEKLEKYSKYEEWSAILICLSLIMEAVAVFEYANHPLQKEDICSIVLNMALAFAILGEIISTRKISSISKALLRISEETVAKLQKETEIAKLEQEKLKSLTQWRIISSDTKNELIRRLTANKSVIFAECVANDPEALFYAEQLLVVFKKAGWGIVLKLNTYRASVFDIILPPRFNNSYTSLVCDAFANCGINFSNEDFPLPISSIPAFTIPTDTKSSDMNKTVRIIVGSKPILLPALENTDYFEIIRPEKPTLRIEKIQKSIDE